jgi:8-amino-7-oxononanoate synthase
LQELTHNPALFQLGSKGSRLLDGNSLYAESIERDIARFHNAPDGLLCNSGFDANSGLFSCMPQLGDIIIHDEFIHASVHDGIRLSRAGNRLSFMHNSVEDFREKLERCVTEDALVRQGCRNVFIAVESIYSMDGDLAPLAEIVDLVERMLPKKNGHVIVDEAHATGVLGPLGKGLVCELGLENRVFARLHTFGKALACGGGEILLKRHSWINRVTS